jgi:hypothetical protein
VRVAVSGSHGTGKSTLIAAFLARCPEYLHEPEAFETLGDDVDLDGDTPTPEGLQLLLEHTGLVVARHPAGARVIHERSPADYLGYAAASGRSWTPEAVSRFLAEQVPAVRGALRHLDLIVLLPVTAAARAGEGVRFRRRVDEHLRRALLDDEYDLFGGGAAPRVVELPASPERQLAQLLRLTDSAPA